MEKYMLLFVLLLVSLSGMSIVYAQGFIEPGANPPPLPGTGVNPLPQPPPPAPGVNPPPPPPLGPHDSSGRYGFIGPSQTITVVQAQTLAHRTPVIVRGNIVQAIGSDLYTFRDSSGEIILRIGPREWQNFGFNISPSDTMEISGELHRDQRDWQRAPEIHARYMRKL